MENAITFCVSCFFSRITSVLIHDVTFIVVELYQMNNYTVMILVSPVQKIISYIYKYELIEPMKRYFVQVNVLVFVKLEKCSKSFLYSYEFIKHCLKVIKVDKFLNY